MEFDLEKFAGNLRAARARLDMSQDVLAMAAGIDIDSISRYERAKVKPGADALAKLAKALGTTPNELLGWPSE